MHLIMYDESSRRHVMMNPLFIFIDKFNKKNKKGCTSFGIGTNASPVCISSDPMSKTMLVSLLLDLLEFAGFTSIPSSIQSQDDAYKDLVGDRSPFLSIPCPPQFSLESC